MGDNNHRVQVFGPQGEFMFMFGWNVNKTKVANGGTQEEKNVCTEAEITGGVTCGGGERGTGLAGQIENAESVAVDPSSGDAYVLDSEYHRVDKYSATGEFLWMVGGDVNRKGGNLCTKAEEDECQAGVEGGEHLAFAKLQPGGHGNLMSIGGPEDHLFVADEGRVQELDTNGGWVGQIPVPGEALAVAVDETGGIFVVDSSQPGVHEYNTGGALQPCVIDPTGEGIQSLALDSDERLGLSESGSGHAAIYDALGAECGKLVTQIPGLSGTAMAFSLHENSNSEAEDLLYVADSGDQRIEGYLPVVFPEVRTTACVPEVVGFTSASVCGEVNPNGIQARAFFKYGVQEDHLEEESSTAFVGETTAFDRIATELTELIPNQRYFYQTWVEARSEGVEQRQSASETLDFRTRGPPPQVPGQPAASLVGSGSVSLSASVNPEHAVTSYHFEYARCESESQAFATCQEPKSTNTLSSATYGLMGVTQEISGLIAQTTYAYRLVADNEFEIEGHAEGGRAVGAEGHFTTTPLPVPSATTGGASAVTSTGVIISGTVNPEGPAATYLFELGVYAGADTQYGIVFSGPVDEGTQPFEEQLALAGLQPATTYAYRITVESGYIVKSGETQGATRVFTTGGVPVLLESPPAPVMLGFLPNQFPETAKPPSRKPLAKCKRGFQRNKRNKCVKIKRAKKTARSGKQARVTDKWQA